MEPPPSEHCARPPFPPIPAPACLGPGSEAGQAAPGGGEPLGTPKCVLDPKNDFLLQKCILEARIDFLEKMSLFPKSCLEMLHIPLVLEGVGELGAKK